MKDLGEACYVLGIKICRDSKRRTLALSQATYIDKILERFSMENSKNRKLPSRYEITLCKDQCPKTSQKEEDMRKYSYALAVESLLYVMLCTRFDICYIVWIVSRYKFNSGLEDWIAIKHILKYLPRMIDLMLVYFGGDFNSIGYTDFDFQLDKNSQKSTSGPQNKAMSWDVEFTP
uniref:Reverse transcriptase Ty1/copia-type domain-containing protein n=1 Tax=Cannabis sativa TaxID=3483 RepID=A0A803PUQ7_CANSA